MHTHTHTHTHTHAHTRTHTHTLARTHNHIQADVFSAGIVFYELYFCVHPDDRGYTEMRHLVEDIEAAEDALVDAPEETADKARHAHDLMLQMTAERPRDRLTAIEALSHPYFDDLRERLADTDVADLETSLIGHAEEAAREANERAFAALAQFQPHVVAMMQQQQQQQQQARVPFAAPSPYGSVGPSGPPPGSFFVQHGTPGAGVPPQVLAFAQHHQHMLHHQQQQQQQQQHLQGPSTPNPSASFR